MGINSSTIFTFLQILMSKINHFKNGIHCNVFCLDDFKEAARILSGRLAFFGERNRVIYNGVYRTKGKGWRFHAMESRQDLQNILSKSYSSREIKIRRKKVSSDLLAGSGQIKGPSICAISSTDLRLLFDLYDRIFLNNWFAGNYRGEIAFSLSRRMTKSAGKTICRRSADPVRPENMKIEIRIGVDFFLQYNAIEGSKMVCGIPTDSALEALQLVFEHELCHVMEFVLFGESSCSRQRFRTLASHLFGHTESYHKLPTQRQIADRRFGLQIGGAVSFVDGKKELSGVIYNINKRATVLVQDPEGDFIDRRGNRYTKYYVPLPLLKR